ncbi:MalY/PatB family protein [Halalkalibacterium ligniniphilum]|uniref:MalY/PatB family protein n=1 Tax=Halalkalibacterium ligniniphilum TaxID=1134413 RepID=UPI000347706A|nr:MalY/PatB family protein [Halalkalibacterium ligniniphilum]
MANETVFDQVINRKGTASAKWDYVDTLYKGNDLLPMWVADMDFQAPAPVIEAIQSRAAHGIFGYPTHTASVDKAVQSWAKRHYNWDIDPEDLIYTSGIVPTISRIIEAFTNEKDRIVIQTPVYHPFYDLVTNNKRELIKNPLIYDGTSYKMDFAQLESGIDSRTKMLILCNPHNPVGRVWTKEELEKLAQICVANDLLVVSDEIHADLLYEGFQHIPIASLSEEMASRTFTCLAPSKTFNLAGIQTSYVVIKNSVLRAGLKKHLTLNFMNMTNSFAELVTEVAYNQGEQWLQELRAYIQGNEQYVRRYVETHMPKISLVKPEGTYLLWLDCSKLGLSANERKKWLVEEARVALNHGPMFGKEEGDAFERMNIACPRKTIQEGLERIKKAYVQRGF